MVEGSFPRTLNSFKSRLKFFGGIGTGYHYGLRGVKTSFVFHRNISLPIGGMRQK